MTLVHVALTVPAPDGEDDPASGVLRFVPTARRVADGVAVLPVPFQANLVAGVADVELAPNDVSWLWRIDEYVTGAPSRTVYVSVSGETANYADLTPIDPDTLEPAATADPAWVAPYEELVARVDAGVVTPDPANPGFYLIGT
jgi:hypothetical protein